MKRIHAALAGCLLFASVISVQASDVVKSINQAKDNYLTGHPTKAALKLKESVYSLWQELPLSVHKIRLVTDLTDYLNKKDNVYKLEEPIYMTSQVFGHEVRQVGDGYSINVAADFTVLSADGTVLGGAQDVLQLSKITPIPTTDFSLDLTYSISGASAGTYTIRTIVRDLNSQKTTNFDQTVVLK